MAEIKPQGIEVQVILFGELRKQAALYRQKRINADSPQSEIRKAMRQTSWRWR